LEKSPLEMIDISDNYIKASSIEKLGNLMKNKSLKILKISDCNIDPDISDTFGDILK
jgi:hypothetical protein